MRIDPTMPAAEAATAILMEQLAVMREKEDGIRADVDPERLHEYRVAVRRTRALLRELQQVFPADAVTRFRNGFRLLGQETNRLRDLDVYLLAEADYRAMLPTYLQDGIRPIFAVLAQQRRDAWAQVIAHLGAAEYGCFLQEWEEFLLSAPTDSATSTRAETPILDIARKRIYKRYRRIIKDGAYILTHMEDELLHELRLECKRLRYLLEFFADLFPSKQIRKLTRQLKTLQDNLGKFTDLDVQQQALLAVATQLPRDNSEAPQAMLATGALLHALAQQQQTVKAEFAATFAKFAKPANQKRYRALFAPKKVAGQ